MKNHPEQFQIVFASANADYQKLYKIATELKIKKIALTDYNTKILHTDNKIKLYQGKNELINLIKNEEYDILINAVSGSAGLPYTIATLKTGKDLALANKESLVMAGELIYSEFGINNPKLSSSTNLRQQKRVSRIIPIDSEHSAIFQVLQSQMDHDNSQFKTGTNYKALTPDSIFNEERNSKSVRNLHLTASGGAFRTLPLVDFDKIDLNQTLMHPTWDMGMKVTIDSATMMNKGLEVIEAHWLFGIDYQNINAVIHPQSVIHSLVEFIDGSMIAQMSVPSMQLPILYALTFPERIKSDKIKTTLTELSALTFEPVDPKRYPLYYIARDAAVAGGIMPTILNASNEKAIELFIKGKIKFTDIFKHVEKALNSYENISNPDLDTILQINEECQN